MNADWLEVLARHSPGGEGPGWDDVLTGYDFGILVPEAIQAWARGRRSGGPAHQALVTLRGEEMLDFEVALWDACVEGAGKLPRPGSRRWERAQDRWRLALLREALGAPLTLEALALVVEAIYGQVGCPEDMLGLWKRSASGSKEADLVAIGAFLHRQERRLAEKSAGQGPGSCYTGASAGV